MPKLLKKVEGEIYEPITNNVVYVKSVSGEVQVEDYINIGGFIAFLQNLSEVQVTSRLSKPLNFGLKNNINIQPITLNVDY